MACHKSGNQPNPAVKATLGDSSFSSVKATAALAYGQFSIVASSSTQAHTLAINFTEPFQLNVPLSVDFAKTTVGYLSLNDTLIYNSSIGAPARAQLTVTTWDSVNHHIAGSFSGMLYANAKDSLALTNGAFDLGYTVH